jgi:hypothetical protein
MFIKENRYKTLMELYVAETWKYLLKNLRISIALYSLYHLSRSISYPFYYEFGVCWGGIFLYF